VTSTGGTVRLHVDLDTAVSLAELRRFVRRELGCALDALALDTAVLVAHELVTNARRHGSEPIALDVAVDAREVAVAVTDHGGGEPHVVEPYDGGGRGLAIIDALTDAWGVEPHDGSKKVWAHLRTSPDRRVG
jgi:anti-sigma regulatory factor (Ser/Thr protein kinase)